MNEFKPTHRVINGDHIGLEFMVEWENSWGHIGGKCIEGLSWRLDKEDVEEIPKTDIGFRELQKQLHKDSFNKGWWHTPEGEDLRKHPFTFPTKAMLIVTEVAEAIEGDRKDIPDAHLPQYSMKAVELADVQIRLMDLAEAYGIDLLEVILAKQAYNRQREDHKPENRAKKNGKKY
jgi:NTP pyrophosphatase (non-canonical NTP hydrolase)